MDEIGITIPEDKVATLITADDVEKAALILVMEKGVLKEKSNCLYVQFPPHQAKMRLFTELEGKSDDIIDLYDQEEADLVRREILRISSVIDNRIEYLLRLANDPAAME